MGRLIKIIVAILLFSVLTYVGYHQIGKWHKRSIETSLVQEQEVWQQKTEKLEEKITSLQEELDQQRDAKGTDEKLAEVFGDKLTVVPTDTTQVSCEELEHQITSFFTYLDKKKYKDIYGLEGDTHDLFQKVVEQLSEKPPIVTGELKGISTLISNMAHFYRVLGRKQVGCINEILKNESDVMETMMATFFAWFASGDRCETLTKCSPYPEVWYTYASFFLNTLAGKSYLLRRDSKMRILANYYCVLILDKANDEILNTYGIDIRPHIDFLIQDMDNQKGLAYKSQYLKTLKGLKEKYHL